VALPDLKEHDMSHAPLPCQGLSPAAYAILRDAACERAVGLRAEAVDAAAVWLGRALVDAARRWRHMLQRQPHRAPVWID